MNTIKLNKLLTGLVEKDRILIGSVLKSYKKCGRANCKCAKDKKNWHGPYHIWTRKENGKTITKTLNLNQVSLVEEAIRNMGNLKILIEEWKRYSLTEIEKVSK